MLTALSYVLPVQSSGMDVEQLPTDGTVGSDASILGQTASAVSNNEQAPWPAEPGLVRI